jgi:Na+/H+ antiporter NhaC
MVFGVNKSIQWIGILAWIIVAAVARRTSWDFTPILPSICALTLVALFRSALLGLLGGAFIGAMLAGPSSLFAPIYLFNDLLLPALQSRWNLCVLIFTLIMGGFVGLLDYGGGVTSLVMRLSQRGKALSTRMEWLTFGLGFGCFFDGLANSMLVGSTMRPLMDQTKGSRSRLAYIADSTSSPVACIAFFSTWIAYQLSMIQEGLSSAGIDANPYLVFLSSIPGNYYCWFTLALVAIAIHRNWNPVHPAEDFIDPNTQEAQTPESTFPIALSTVWVPLLFLITALPLSLWLSGRAALAQSEPSHWVDTLAAADTAMVMVLVGLGAAVIAATLYPRNAAVSSTEAFRRGMFKMISPALILIGAWALSGSLKELDAGTWIGGLLAGNIPGWLLPALVFVTGSTISFLTGTSWGTMGILVPLAIPLGAAAGTDPGALEGIGTAVLAAAFSGAVFGDHCSPISDTTIVSSLAAGVSPFEHVRTQLPFAFTAAAIAIVPGFLLAGTLGLLWPGLLAGFMALFILMIFLPKRARCASIKTY